MRDLLLGREPRELDLVVEGDAPALARRLAERLGGRAVVHEPFGTALVRWPGGVVDLASARIAKGGMGGVTESGGVAGAEAALARGVGRAAGRERVYTGV